MAEINVIGNQRELFPKHLFLVSIDPAWWTGFQKCSELSCEIAKIEYWEGASIIPWKLPGRVTVTDVTLERGASKSQSFYLWCLQVANATYQKVPTRGKGDNVPNYLKNIEIKQLDRDTKTVRAKWRLHNGWVQKFVAGEWDNTADEVVIESVTISFDFFTREPV